MAGRVRGVYGKPWSKMAGRIPITKEVLGRLGEALVEAVVVEARKDLAKQGRRPTRRGEPEGLPVVESFFDSFSYKISGKSTVEIISTWPWVQQHIEGRDPYPMKWLTQGKLGGRAVPIMQQDGTIIIRMAPFRAGDYWIHPGFARHTFIERGVRKAREKMAEIIMEEVMAMLSTGDPSR